MKAVLIQPPYSWDVSFSEEYFQYKMDLLDQCREADIIVLPEYSDVPCATKDLEETLFYHKKYINPLLDKCRETARRLHSMVFVNALSLEETGYRNTTYCFDRQGELRGKYFKKHLPPLEQEVLRLDSDYTFEYSEPYVLEMEGLRFGFLTCYDFYFYEAFANMARKNLDIIIGCSLQRSDSHDAIEIMCRFLAYNTNAYVLRSSVSFDEESTLCGASMAVSPRGEVLANLKGKFGAATAEFDPGDKYYKPAGYGNPPAAHYEYIEYGRKPWQYRQAGSAIRPNDRWMAYPRICAHRGFNTVAPENSLPAFGAALALGASELEFDLWPTKDDEIVSIHDAVLDRVSDGTGYVYDHTYEELLQYDFGVKFGEKFKGLKILKFEEILQKFAGQVVMNVHIKDTSKWEVPYQEKHMQKIIDLIRQYDCAEYVYFMSGSRPVLEMAQRMAPDIARCAGEESATIRGRQESRILETALLYDCKKVQFFKPFFNQGQVDLAHRHGLICNVFWSDEPEEAQKLLEMGMDTILTNDYLNVSRATHLK